MRKINARGETIVEVLIVMVILASVLGDAFAITTRALNQNRAAQERAEAANVAQSQIELLRSAVFNDKNFTTGLGSYFCVNTNGSSFTLSSITNVGSFSSACQSGRYSNYFTYNSLNNLYTETVIWNNVTGSGNDTLQVLYRPAILSFMNLPLASRRGLI